MEIKLSEFSFVAFYSFILALEEMENTSITIRIGQNSTFITSDAVFLIEWIKHQMN